MTDAAFKATAYIKDGCPFSFKFLVFMTEGRLLDRIEIVRMREGDPTFAAKKQHLAEQLGKPATFPTVEVEPHRYLTDSDLLIEHFARRHGLRPDDMPVLLFYKQTIFPQLIELYKIKTGKS